MIAFQLLIPRTRVGRILVTVIPEEEPEEEEEEAREEIAVDCGVRAVGIVAVDGGIEAVMISD